MPHAAGPIAIRTTSPWGLTVSAYLVRDRGTVALIDSGFPSRIDVTLEALAAVDVTPQDVDLVVYTHSHIDHMGGGIAFESQLPNAEHVFWEGTVPASTNYHTYYDSLPSWTGWLRDALPPSAERDRVVKMFEGGEGTRYGTGELPRRRPVAFGEAVQVGGLKLECVDARGHDPFHVAWYEREHGWMFTGDVLMRLPTPILPVLRDDLGAYRQTLRRLRSFEADVFFPGHGRPRSDFHASVAWSEAHVRSHFDRVAGALSDGPVDVTAISVGMDAPAMSVAAATRRAFIDIGVLLAQMEELAERGLVRRRDDRLWERTGALPTYDALYGS